MVEANKAVLKNLKVTLKHNLPTRLPQDPTVLDLAEVGIRNPDAAWEAFQAVWNELTEPNSNGDTQRPPVLLAADNISYLFGNTEYMTIGPKGRLVPIHAYDFVLPKHYADYFGGSRSLPNGGMVLGATSVSARLVCPPLEVGIDMAEARANDPGAKLDVKDFWNPLHKTDWRVLDTLVNLESIPLKGIPKEQARELIEYCAGSGMVREIIEDKWVSAKWTLSGCGVLGQLEKAVVIQRF